MCFTLWTRLPKVAFFTCLFPPSSPNVCAGQEKKDGRKRGWGEERDRGGGETHMDAASPSWPKGMWAGEEEEEEEEEEEQEEEQEENSL